MRTLAKLRLPTVLFVNKIDRVGARYDDLLAEIRDKLTPAAIAMGSVTHLGTREATYEPFDDEDLRRRAGEPLAGNDDTYLASYLDGVSGGERDLLVAQTAKAQVFPVFFGSAITGEGVAELADGIRALLPGRKAGEDLHGEVFKIDRGATGERIAYARLYSGTLAVRDRVTCHRSSGTGSYDAKVSALRVFDRGRSGRATRMEAGQIAMVSGLGEIRIGDQLGRYEPSGAVSFAAPTLETAVRVVDPSDETRLVVALQKLAEQDPLIRVRTRGREVSVCLYGEVQKEVIGSLLESDFGVDAFFEATQPIYLERPVGTGAALRDIDEEDNLCAATVGLRIEPGPDGSGVRYELGVELGGLPRAFHTAIEETVRLELQEGLFGWEVTDCLVTLTHTACWSPVSTAGDFRKLTPEVLRAALREAGTRVYEPVDRFEAEVPPDTVSAVLARLAEAGATVQETTVQPGSARLAGVIPAGRVHAFEILLPGLSRGEGLFLSSFEGFRPVAGPAPGRVLR